MTRTVGTAFSRTDTATNRLITQSGGTNYPFMIADINEGGPLNVRYIHWRGTADFNVSEVLCYTKKRFYPDQFATSKTYWTAQNGPILSSHCHTESAEFTDINYSSNQKLWRIVAITDNGQFKGKDDVKEFHMIKGGDKDQCDEDEGRHGYDCYEKAYTHSKTEMKLDGGKSVTYCSLIYLGEGNGAPAPPVCTEQTIS